MAEKRVYGFIDENEEARMKSLLRAEVKKGGFVKSSFAGVWTKQLDIQLVPAEILEAIGVRGGRVSSFFIVMTNNYIPLHQHNEFGEVYLGGKKNDTVMIHAGADSNSPENGEKKWIRDYSLLLTSANRMASTWAIKQYQPLSSASSLRLTEN